MPGLAQLRQSRFLMPASRSDLRPGLGVERPGRESGLMAQASAQRSPAQRAPGSQQPQAHCSPARWSAVRSELAVERLEPALVRLSKQPRPTPTYLLRASKPYESASTIINEINISRNRNVKLIRFPDVLFLKYGPIERPTCLPGFPLNRRRAAAMDVRPLWIWISV